MKVGIIGMGGCGKSTLFSALTGMPLEYGAFSVKPRVGVVKVPDARLDTLRGLFNPKKFTPTALEFMDYAPIGHAQNNEIVAAVREADVLVVLLREFQNPSVPAPEKGIDPAREWQDIQSEFLIQDLALLEKRIDKLKVQCTKATKTQEQDKRELALIQRMHAHLEKQSTLADFHMTPDEEKPIQGFRLLTRKPALLAINVNLEELDKPRAYVGIPATALRISAAIEQEMSMLPPEEREVFQKEFGIRESLAHRLIQETYRILNFRSFFTVGEDEVRSWTITAGDSAFIAAGKIHTDIQRGFIRAEVISYADMIASGDMKTVKANNQLRLEGKDYVVQDGDIVHFRFSV